MTCHWKVPGHACRCGLFLLMVFGEGLIVHLIRQVDHCFAVYRVELTAEGLWASSRICMQCIGWMHWVFWTVELLHPSLLASHVAALVSTLGELQSCPSSTWSFDVELIGNESSCSWQCSSCSRIWSSNGRDPVTPVSLRLNPRSRSHSSLWDSCSFKSTWKP